MALLAPPTSDAPISGADAGNPEVSLHVPLQRMQIRSHSVVPLFHFARPCVSYPADACTQVKPTLFGDSFTTEPTSSFSMQQVTSMGLLSRPKPVSEPAAGTAAIMSKPPTNAEVSFLALSLILLILQQVVTLLFYFTRSSVS